MVDNQALTICSIFLGTRGCRHWDYAKHCTSSFGIYQEPGLMNFGDTEANHQVDE